MRVIAGSARGRPLRAPPGGGIRPTTDLVKGAMFSMLEAEAMRHGDERFPYQRVLDLYAGSGALGIEALSRGSAFVDFLETDAQARAAIQRNLEATGFTTEGRVHARRAEDAPSTLLPPYDLILADPPYAYPGIVALLERVGNSQLLAEDGLFILEHARSFEPLDAVGCLRLDRVRAHGATRIALFRRGERSG